MEQNWMMITHDAAYDHSSSHVINAVMLSKKLSLYVNLAFTQVVPIHLLINDRAGLVTKLYSTMNNNEDAGVSPVSSTSRLRIIHAIKSVPIQTHTWTA